MLLLLPGELLFRFAPLPYALCRWTVPGFTLLRRGKSHCPMLPESFGRSAYLRLRLFAPLQPKEKDFQSLNWDEGEAEAEAAAARVGAVVAPARRTAVLRVAAPTAATVHAVRAG